MQKIAPLSFSIHETRKQKVVGPAIFLFLSCQTRRVFPFSAIYLSLLLFRSLVFHLYQIEKKRAYL